MIEADDVMPLVLAAVPSLGPVWEAEVRDENASESAVEDRLHYLDAAAVARHLVGLLTAGTTDELPAFFALLERLDVEGSPYVSELATIGYLEDLQSLARQAGLPDSAVVPLLGPIARARYAELDTFWTEVVAHRDGLRAAHRRRRWWPRRRPTR